MRALKRRQAAARDLRRAAQAREYCVCVYVDDVHVYMDTRIHMCLNTWIDVYNAHHIQERNHVSL